MKFRILKIIIHKLRNKIKKKKILTLKQII